MVMRSNMVTVFKLKHPCIRCCAENTFVMERSNSQKSIRTNCSARVLGIAPVKHFIVGSGTIFKPILFPVTGSFGILLIRLLSEGTIQYIPLTSTPLLMMVYLFNRFYLLMMLTSVILQLVFKRACC